MKTPTKNKSEILSTICNSLKHFEIFPFSFINLKNNIFFKRDISHLLYRDSQKRKYLFYKSCLFSNAFDIQNLKNYCVDISSKNPLKYARDNNIYRYINKRIHYRNISTLSILKLLHKNKKLSSIAYKKAKRNFNNIQLQNTIRRAYNQFPKGFIIEKTPAYYFKYTPLSDHVKRLLSGFLKTIKTNESKNTLSSLDRIRINSKREYIILRFEKQNYKVIFKKSYSKLKSYNPISNFESIFKEFKTRLAHSYITEKPLSKLEI